MKKLLVILLALAMPVMMFTGCAKESGTAETDGDTYKIGIVQMMEHPSLNTIRESIIEGLAEEGFVDGENIEIIYQNGQNDMTTMQNIAQTFVGEEVDVIVAIATQAAQASLAETTDIPIVFAAITDPVGAGLVESLDAPGGNVTGTSDEISAADIMDLAQQITPGFKTIGALYNIGEDNSESVISDLKEYAAANGFEVVESTVTNTSEVQQAAQYLADKADVVFSPIDNTVASSMALAADVFNEAGIPFYVSADSMVADGGLATYGIDYTVLGKETAGMVAEVLRGADPASMAVRKMSEMSIYINTDTAEALGIEISQDILDQNKLEG
ncbi:MAG: ABC transporter substrate-binding protein [Anaerovoracaceae bacterium]|nr:ABC transporter substrate-binding protein [Anaerovoracaceae bacterium]